MKNTNYEGFAGLSNTAWLVGLVVVLTTAIVGVLAISIDWSDVEIFQADWSSMARDLEQAVEEGDMDRASMLAKELRKQCPDKCRPSLDAYSEALVAQNKAKGESLYDTTPAPASVAADEGECPDATKTKYFNKSKTILPVAKSEDDLDTMTRCAVRGDSECVKRLTWFYLKPCDNFTVQTQGLTRVEIQHSSGKTGFIPADYVGKR